jgi:hypothetical protein
MNSTLKKFLFVLSLLMFGCMASQENAKPASILVDITKESSLNFVHEPGVDGSYFMPESLGSGGAFFDYDNDGDLDILLINGGWHGKQTNHQPVKNHLYRQEPNHQFVDVTNSSGMDSMGYGMGATIGDIDNDGDLDVYITNYESDVLYRNNGNGSFTDISREAGIKDSLWGASAVFFDFDRDGFLDLYVANYVAFDPGVTCTDKGGRPDYCGPKAYAGVPDILYHNNGNGTFTDVSKLSKIGNVSSKGLGVLSADFNRDGYPDLYVTNDGEPNFLWINQKDNTFADQGGVLGAAVNSMGQPEASMGITAGDVDNDGDLDLFMTHLREEKDTFYRNYGKSGFQDESWEAGIAGPSIPTTGFGAGFFDYDQDGDLDLAVVNGRVTRGPLLTKNQPPQYWDDYAEPNLLYRNEGGGHFRLVPEDAGTFASTVENSRGLAFGDIDHDGDIDLLVTNEGQQARLYRNDGRNKGHWLMIQALEPRLKRDAIGAEVTIHYQGKAQTRVLSPAYSYLCSNDPRVHFGLGSANTIDKIVVRWVDGTQETYPGVKADQFITLKRSSGK